jgi:hypothetical protein
VNFIDIFYRAFTACKISPTLGHSLQQQEFYGAKLALSCSPGTREEEESEIDRQIDSETGTLL